MATLLSDTALDEASRFALDLAAKLGDVDQDLAHRVHHLVWRGSAADHFGTRMTPVRDAFHERSGDLSRVAHLLKVAAEKLREQRAGLTRDQNLVEAILRGQADPTAFLRSVGWTEPALPPVGDTAWQGAGPAGNPQSEPARTLRGGTPVSLPGIVSTGTARWALSIEELRVIGLVTSATLPPLLRVDLADDDLVLTEAVATRSLLAHGLAVQTDEGGIALAPGAATYLAPLLAPAVVAEVEVDTGQRSNHVVFAGDDGVVLALHERELDIWSVERPEGSLASVVWGLIELTDDSAVTPTATCLRLPAPVNAEIKRLALADHWEAVDRRLAEAGAGGEEGQRWRTALRSRWMAGSLRLCRTLAPDVYEAGAVRWLDAGPAGMWQLSDERGDEEDEELVVTIIEDVGHHALRGDLLDLLGAE